VLGASDPQRELLDVESVAGHLLPAGSVFAFLAEHRSILFPAEMFADLFRSGLGRPSVPPDVVAAVLVLQALHGLSDRQTAEAVTFDLRWKAAVGLPVTAAAFRVSVPRNPFPLQRRLVFLEQRLRADDAWFHWAPTLAGARCPPRGRSASGPAEPDPPLP